MNSKVIVIGVAAALAVSLGLVQASEDERDEYGERGEYSERYQSRSTSAVDASYVEECSACHIAYPASMLPQRSWEKMMANLDDHFGENAELDAELNQHIKDYLVANAGDARYGSSKMLRSLASNETPLRISDLPYFKKEHREIPAGALKDKRVGSISNCQNCHQRAAEGSFREREINIPGYGRWDD